MSKQPCPMCGSSELVEAGPVTEGKAKVKCVKCGHLFEVAEGTRRKLLG